MHKKNQVKYRNVYITVHISFVIAKPLNVLKKSETKRIAPLNIYECETQHTLYRQSTITSAPTGQLCQYVADLDKITIN